MWLSWSHLRPRRTILNGEGGVNEGDGSQHLKAADLVLLALLVHVLEDHLVDLRVGNERLLIISVLVALGKG